MEEELLIEDLRCVVRGVTAFEREICEGVESVSGECHGWRVSIVCTVRSGI